MGQSSFLAAHVVAALAHSFGVPRAGLVDALGGHFHEAPLFGALETHTV